MTHISCVHQADMNRKI